MAVNIDNVNQVGDRMRLLQKVVSALFLIAFGYLLATFLNGSQGNLKTDIQSTGDYSAYLSAISTDNLLNVPEIIPSGGVK